MIDPLSLTAIGVMVVPMVLDWLVLTIRDAKGLYKRSQEFKNKVDSLANRIANEYNNKWATTTPSTRPTIESFVNSKVTAYKDEVLALQRKAEDLDNRIQANKDNTHWGREKHLEDQQAQLESAFTKLEDKENKLNTEIAAVTQGSKYKFTNADKVKEWTKKGEN